MKILTVIPLQKGIFKGDLTYFTAKEVYLGDVVIVPVRNKKVLGLVVKIEELSESKTEVKNLDFGLRKIIENKGPSFFRPEFTESALETATFFASQSGDILGSLIPNILKEDYDGFFKLYKNNETDNKTKNSNIKNEKLLLQTSIENRISIYKTLIRSSFAKKHSVFIVVPTEYDLDIFYETLSKGIESFTFALHSNLPKKKLTEKLKNLFTLEHPVLILATAPFLSVPRGDIRTIAVEHESSSSYKTLTRPYMDMRTFTEIFASKIGAQFILADTILRFETLGRKDRDGFGAFAPLSYRLGFSGDIEIQNKNTRQDKKEWRIFSEKNIEEIKSMLAKKRKVFIFSLRKGLATYTICRDCADTVLCDTCTSPLVLYLSKDGQKRMFVCNKCKTEKSPDTRCKNCGSWNLLPLGIGVDTVHKEIKNIFDEEKVQIFKLDKDTAKNKKDAEKIIEDYEKAKYAILVGTEIALFYIREKVPLTFIASFDAFWSIPNYKISERILQLLLNIASKTENKIIIQTKKTSDSLLQNIKTGLLTQFVREELSDRKTLAYPPYSRFIKIVHIGDKIKTSIAKKFLEEHFKEYNPEVFTGYSAKQKNKYTTTMILKVEPEFWSLPSITPKSRVDPVLLGKILSLTPNFAILVDPEDLL